MMYNWPLMIHRYFVCAKLMFSKAVLCQFPLMEQFFLMKFFSRTQTLRGKKLRTIDIWWLIDTLCAQNLCFLKQFCVSFHQWNKFSLKIFLKDLYIKRKKVMYNWPLMTHRYFVCAKLMFSKAVLCSFSLMEQFLLKKFFSRTQILRGKKLRTIDIWWLIDSLCEQNWSFLKQFCVPFHQLNNFLKRNFSPGLVH